MGGGLRPVSAVESDGISSITPAEKSVAKGSLAAK